MSPSREISVQSASHSTIISHADYGVQKCRKQASTGGGRAWSEDEESYLLQTRRQKTPYKHIAAHLNKTELACRLHYHQLCHGSARRKRTNSLASSDATTSVANSPVMLGMSPPNGQAERFSDVDQFQRPQAYVSTPSHVQLPPAATLIANSCESMGPGPRQPNSYPHPGRYSNSPPLLPKQLPRLNCENTNTRDGRQEMEYPSHIGLDLERLRAIYDMHRFSFWSLIASEYDGETPPQRLEDAWKQIISSVSMPSYLHGQAQRPLTPCVSPHDLSPDAHRWAPSRPTSTHEHEAAKRHHAPSISALLGIDASPRSPEEREMIRRIEEARSHARSGTDGIA